MTEFSNKYERLQSSIGYFFKDINLLENALTHRGFYHSSKGNNPHNEKLEFLGDRVLGLVISSYIYKNYQNSSVGEMARYFSYIVSSSNLLEVAHSINIENYVKINKTQINLNTVDKILIDATEAIISAVFLDSNFETAQKVVLLLFKNSFKNIGNKILNPKGLLQEFTQKNNCPLPDYEIVNQSGPDHKPTFKVRLTVKGYDTIEVESLNVKNAQKELAELFIKKHIQKND